MKRLNKYLPFNLFLSLLLLTISAMEVKGWKSIEIVGNDTIPMVYNISEDMQIGFTPSHLTLASKYYSLEIPREEVSEIKLSHNIVEDHSYIPEPEIPDVKEDPDEGEDPDKEKDPNEGEDPDEGENPDNGDNPDEGKDPDDNKGSDEKEEPDIATGIHETENRDVFFENDRILFPSPTDVAIYSVDGICRDVLKGCVNLNINSLPSGINILVFNGHNIRINK